MENLSTGQNLGQNQGGSPWRGDSSNSSSRVGDFNRGQREAVLNSENQDEIDEAGEDEESQEESAGEEEGNGAEKGQLAQIMGNVIGEAEDAAREATGEALRQSWINLFTTYGLTFLYINFHYIMAYLGGPFARFFPKAGREWLSKFTKGMPLPEQLKKEAEETIGAGIEPFELGLVILVDVLIILLLLAIIFIAYVIITDPSWFTIQWFHAVTGL